jgi:G3E family GTPase
MVPCYQPRSTREKDCYRDPPRHTSAMSSNSASSSPPPVLLPASSPPPSLALVPSPTVEPVGVTVVAGFLGSGKSTLVRRILTEHHGLRVLVVENEFGDGVSSSIESAVLLSNSASSSSDAVTLVDLPNGCVCCAASDALTDALARLLRAPGPRRFDHIVIEASGLADPGPVAAALWVDAALDTALRLDAILTVVDAYNLPVYLSAADKSALAEKQIALADAVLVNKMDLVLPAARAAVRAQVAALAPSYAPILDTVHCDTPLPALLSMHAYDATRARERVLGTELHPRAAPSVHPGPGVAAVSVTFDDVLFDAALLDRAFGGLLWNGDGDRDGNGERDNGLEIWRVKALANVRGTETSVVYQAVHTLFEADSSGIEWEDGQPRVSKFVFIGRRLDQVYLRKVLLTAAVST